MSWLPTTRTSLPWLPFAISRGKRPRSSRRSDRRLAMPGFSTAGKRDLDDPRNNLLIRAGQIAVALKPKVFVLENVPAGHFGKAWKPVGTCRVHAQGCWLPCCEGHRGRPDKWRSRNYASACFYWSWLGNQNIPLRARGSRMHLLWIRRLRMSMAFPGHDPILMGWRIARKKIAGRIEPGQKLCNVRISPAAVPTWDIPEVFGRVSTSEREVLETIQRLRRRDRRRDFGRRGPSAAVLGVRQPREIFRAKHSTTDRSELSAARWPLH